MGRALAARSTVRIQVWQRCRRRAASDQENNRGGEKNKKRQMGPDDILRYRKGVPKGMQRWPMEAIEEKRMPRRTRKDPSGTPRTHGVQGQIAWVTLQTVAARQRAKGRMPNVTITLQHLPRWGHARFQAAKKNGSRRKRQDTRHKVAFQGRREDDEKRKAKT